MSSWVPDTTCPVPDHDSFSHFFEDESDGTCQSRWLADLAKYKPEQDGTGQNILDAVQKHSYTLWLLHELLEC